MKIIMLEHNLQTFRQLTEKFSQLYEESLAGKDCVDELELLSNQISEQLNLMSGISA